MSRLTGREVATALLIPVAPVIALAILAIIFLSGCPAQKTACKVINVANDVCMVLEYVGDDGQPHQVAVSREDLQGLARDVAAKRAAAQQPDAGAKDR